MSLPPSEFTPPPLPGLFQNTSSTTTSSSPAGRPKLLAHGAEALVYSTPTQLSATGTAILKHRPAKPWRHPTLDSRLTRHRILAEARILVRCRREGVPVPAVLALDAEAGWLLMECIGSVYSASGEVARGLTVREGLERWWWMGGGGGGRRDGLQEARELLRRIGRAVGRLHAVGIVHGDLTSSNLMLRSNGGGAGDGSSDRGMSPEQKSPAVSLAGEVVLIDFGLASTSTQEEDRAVDLYVLERAMGSTHPWLEDEFGLMIEGYTGSYKGANITLRRLEDVRMRGRKKSMLG